MYDKIILIREKYFCFFVLPEHLRDLRRQQFHHDQQVRDIFDKEIAFRAQKFDDL